MEIWKDIEGFVGLYQVSNLGRTKRLYQNDKEKILKHGSDKDGYLRVNLYKEGKSKQSKVHRLVAKAFIPNPDNKSQVNHRDENKSNNKVENLEWVTSKENINYGTRTEKVAKSLSKPICGINIKTNEKIEFPSTQEAERNGFDHGNIVKCLKGRNKSHKGYRWFYK